MARIDEAKVTAREEIARGPFYPPKDADPALHFALDLLVAEGEATWTPEGYVKRRRN